VTVPSELAGAPLLALTANQFLLTALTIAWILGFFAGRRRGWDWTRCLGLSLVVFPFARFGLNVVLSIDLLFEQGLVLPALTQAQLWGSVWRSFLYNLVVPTAGLLLVFQGVPRLQLGGDPRGALARILALLRLPRQGWRRDALHGQALFGLVAVFYLFSVLFLATTLGRALMNNDESRVFANITPLLILLLSLLAGVGEEYLFRGVLQEWLFTKVPWPVALLAQAAFFGLVHAGYGTIAHVVGPLAFGILAGLVAMRLGLLAAVIIHAEIDIAYFVLGSGDPILLAAGTLLVLGSVAAIVVTRAESVRTLLRPLPSWSGKPWM